MRQSAIRFHTAVLVLFGTLLCFSACKEWREKLGGKSEMSQEARAQYHCPMHPTYISDKRGDCPICGMALVETDVLQEKPQAASEGKTSDRKLLFYRHPMQPGVTSPVPKKDEMGMDYVPVYEEDVSVSTVSDRASVSLPREKQQLIGVRTTPVTTRELKLTVRASGRVAYDPDLYNAIAEYKEALKSKERIKESPWPDVHERSEALIRSSALRLRQLGLSEDQIKTLGKNFENPINLLFGQAGGSVWIYAQIYEYEIGLVKVGQTIEVTSSAFPGKHFEGEIVAVDSVLSAETRTIRARALIPNPSGLLKPEMFVNTLIRVNLGTKLAIPEEAVIDTGTRQLAFVVKDGGTFEPREVQIGQEADGYFEVLSGLSENEQVVTSANFLIDSESKLKAAIGQATSGHQHQ